MSVRMHHLTGTFPASSSASMCEVVARYWGEGDALARGIYTYRQGVGFGEVMPRVVVCYSLDESGLYVRPDAMVEFPGHQLDVLDGVKVAELVSCLAALEFRASRVDVAFDDFNWVMTPQKINARYARRGRFAPAYGSTQHGDHVTGGFTVQFGSKGKKGCGTQVVIYDKKAESGGEIDAVRYEARFFKERATAAFRVIGGEGNPFDVGAAVHAEAMAAALGALVAGSIDFFDVIGGKRKRAAWWAAIRERLWPL